KEALKSLLEDLEEDPNNSHKAVIEVPDAGLIPEVHASPRCQERFVGCMPWDGDPNTGQFTPDQLAELEVLLQNEADELEVAVREDFEPINTTPDGTFHAYRFVNGPADVNIEWDQFIGDGFVNGRSQLDQNDEALEELIPNEAIGDAARQWLLSVYLNIHVDGAPFPNPPLPSAPSVAVAPQIVWDSPAPFATYVANTVSHEIAHTFGLDEAYYFDDGLPVNTEPFDLMMSEAPTTGDLDSDIRRQNLLRAAMGLQVSGDLPLNAELALFRHNFDHANSNDALQLVITAGRRLSQTSDFSGNSIESASSIESPGAFQLVSLISPAQMNGAGIRNGDFNLNDPADPQFGWTIAGQGSIFGGRAVLNEDDRVTTRFSQTFVIPQGATSLSFTIEGSNLVADAGGPPDAF